jgi:hypothetical protein
MVACCMCACLLANGVHGVHAKESTVLCGSRRDKHPLLGQRVVGTGQSWEQWMPPLALAAQHHLERCRTDLKAKR